MQKGSLQKLNLTLALALLLPSSLTVAAKKEAPKKALPLWEGTTNDRISTEWVNLTPEQFAAEKQEAIKRSKRSIASGDNYESQMSPELKALRQSILSITSAEELDKALGKMNSALDAKDEEFNKLLAAGQRYSEDNRDYYYIASQIAPLRCLRGLAWRFTPLAEKSGVIESRLASEVMQMAQAMQILAPRVEDLPEAKDQEAAKLNKETNISKAVFDYVTLPYDKAVLFTAAWHLQEHLYTSCGSDLNKSAKRLQVLDLTKPIVWDNKMFFGVGTFPDDLDRYKLLGEAERHYSLAMKHNGMHLISFLNAYSLHGYFEMIYTINKQFAKDAGLTGLQAITNIVPGLSPTADFQKIDGVALMERNNIIKDPKFKGVFHLYENRKDLLSDSFKHLKRTVQELSFTWTEIKDRSAEERQVLNPVFLTGFRRGITKTLDTWLKLVEGPQELHSRSTDQKVVVNIMAIYDPKNPLMDLKDLLPTRFDTSQKRFPVNDYSTLIRDEKEPNKLLAAAARFNKRRNYYYGNAQAWDLSQWNKVFPNVAQGDYEGLKQSIRTLQQEWGGSIIAAPFMPFMR